MNLTDKRFWITWVALALLMAVVMAQCSWNEDTMILGIAYVMSQLSTWLCHRIRPKAAFGNNHGGAGFTWWFYLLLLNGVHSIVLLIYTSCIYIKKQ